MPWSGSAHWGWSRTPLEGRADRLTRSPAAELGADGVTVNAITPGLIATDTAVRTGVTDDLARVVANQAVPRPQEPDDLISALLFLVDPASSFVTGAALNVDGGFAKH